MCINIKLNDFSYRYEVYQIFNLFFSFSEIEFVDKGENVYYVSIGEKFLDIEHEGESRRFYFKGDNKKGKVKKSVYSFLKDETKKEFPWGTLVGIRPSKIALALLNEGKTPEEIVKHFKEDYLASRKKAELCIQVANYERSIVNKHNKVVSVYIDMPFCPTRCLYCSFASNPISRCKKIVEPYLKALSYEIEKITDFIKDNNLDIETVYFGGGTPTSIDEHQFEYIMEKIYNKLVYGNKIKEFTVECGRPDSLTYNKFNTMKKFQVGRISINPQTMNNETLKTIGRNHLVKDIVEKFNMARSLGFDNINMDIILGLPNEGLKHVQNTCNEILKLKPESFTVHGMAIKRGSKLHNKADINLDLDQVEINSMYMETEKLAEKLHMKPYYMYRQKNMIGNMENVGYCIPNKECIYNIQMIEERQTIIALGADAVSKVIFLDENRIQRVPNVKDVLEYNKRVDEMVERKIKQLKKLYI